MFQPSLVTPNRRRFDKALRTLHELSLWGAKEGLNGLRNILRVRGTLLEKTSQPKIPPQPKWSSWIPVMGSQ
jgi:hypothetical protein